MWLSGKAEMVNQTAAIVQCVVGGHEVAVAVVVERDIHADVFLMLAHAQRIAVMWHGHFDAKRVGHSFEHLIVG